MNNVYQIDTEIGVIIVSKKEYLYTKERVENELCPEDEIRVDGYLAQYSYWKEEIDVNEHTQERTILGRKVMVRSAGRIKSPEILSKFEQELVNNKNDHRIVINLVDSFLKNH